MNFKRTKLFLYLGTWLFAFYKLLFDESFRLLLLAYLTHHQIIAPFILVLLQVLFAMFALPCSTLTILSGALWGAKMGMVYSTIATLIGSAWTFLIGRYWLSKTKHYQRLSSSNWCIKVNVMLGKHGFFAAVLAHLNPLFPGSSLGYFFGMNKISFKSFILGALCGTMPLQFLMVMLGDFSLKVVMTDHNFMVISILFFLVFLVFCYMFLLPAYLKSKNTER